MKRFILNSGPDKDGTLRLGGDDFHYLVRVRRLAPGEFFPALLPGGAEVLVQVRSVEGGVLTGVLSTQRVDSGPSQPGTAQQLKVSTTKAHKGTRRREKAYKAVPLSAPSAPLWLNLDTALPPIILMQALPKGDKMDLIVRQAAEGGVSEIVPFVSEFSIPKIKAEKVSRWERIIKEARQQSGSAIATAVRPPLPLDGLFAYWEELRRPRTVGLLFHHKPLAQASLHGYLDNEPDAAAAVIGPEGGFSPAEAARFMEAGFKPLTIGDSILRTETAALYAAAAIKIILLERNSWETK